MAEDLARWQADKPILARPVNRAERIWRWCRRKPAIASLLLAVAILMVTVAIGSVMAGVRIARESERARKAELEALEKKKAATQELWDSYLAQAQANRLNGRAGRRFDSLEVLAKAAAIRPSLELRNEAIACLALADIRLLKQSKALKKQKESISLDRNQERYAEADERGDVHICRVSDDKELILLPEAVMVLPGTLAVLPGAITPAWPLIRFSPDGQLLAVCNADGRARIWDWQRKESIMEVPVAEFEGNLDFSPDSQWLASSDLNKNLHLFDLARRKEWSLKEHAQGGGVVRFDPTGQLLAVRHFETIRILDAFSGKVLVSLEHPGTWAISFAWHPDGRHLASACADRVLYLWDTQRGKLDRVLKGHDREAAQVAFNHTGDLLASAGYDRTTRLWDFKSGRELVRITGGGHDLQFSSDDQRLGCHSWDANWFEIFEVAPTPVVRAFHEATNGPQRGFGPVGFTSDGALLAYSAGEQLRVWDVASGQEVASHHAGWLGAVLFDASGENLLLSGLRGVWRWPVHQTPITGETLLGPPVALTPSGDYGRAALSANGEILAVLATNRCHIFHTDSAGEIARTEIQSWMRFVAIHPAGTWIATGAWGREGAKVWDGSTGRLSHELPSGEHTAVIFSPDGRWLVTGSEEGYRFWKTGEWTPGLCIAHGPITERRDAPSTMAFSRDGSMLALIDPQTVVRLVDSASGRELATLEAHNGREISSLAFSPDARWLAVADGSDSLHVWDLRAIRQRLANLGFDWEAPPLSPARPSEIKSTKVNFMSDAQALAHQSREELRRKIPTRDPQAAPTLIDLSAYYTAALTDSTYGPPENTLSSLPHGVQTFKGVTFDVRGEVQLSSGRSLKRTFPAEVSDIKVGLRCRHLHFLQASSGAGMPEGTTVGHYRVHYADGSVLQVPLQYGLSIRDYWGHPASGHVDTEKFFVGWTGTNSATRQDGHFLRLFQWIWDNPKPEEEIGSLDFVSAMTGVAPFLLANTAE